LKRRKEHKRDIVFTPTKEVQDLGFDNIFFAYDESNEEWSLHLLYRRVIVFNNNNNNSSATTIKEEEQKQEEQQQPPPSYEERKKIVVDGCDPDRYIPTNNAIRAEFERQRIDKLTMEKFIDRFWDMNLEQKQQATISKVVDGKQQQEVKTTAENNKEEPTTTTSPNYPPIEIKVNSSTDLDPFIPDRDYVEHVFRTLKKTVRCEDSLLRQIVYSALSKDSSNPINLAILAPTSEGKTYAVQQALNYFPKQDVWMIGSMSPKVLIRQNGLLVDKNNKPIQDELIRLKQEIAAYKKNCPEKESLQETLRQLYQNSRILIDLSGKLLVFLEAPHPYTWDILKPILSHDAWEIEHPYVYDAERGSGLGVKSVFTVGWPACIFCSAKNESSWPQWPEIQSRFLITSPNMTSQKYVEGNMLIAQQTGLPKWLQQHLIISEKDIELARKCILYTAQQIRQKSQKNTTTPVAWIPFATTLAKVLPGGKGTDNRYTKRLFSLLTIITLAKAHLRSRLETGDENLSIANLENDLSEALKIVHNLSGIPPFKLKFFTEVILSLFNRKTKKDTSPDGQKQEKIIALTSHEICNDYKKNMGKIISTNNLKQTYLNEFINNGLLEEEVSIINAKQHIYYPLVGVTHGIEGIAEGEELEIQNAIDEDKSKSLPIITPLDKDLQHIDLLLSKNFINVPENWLELEISAFFSHPLECSNLHYMIKKTSTFAYKNSLMIIKRPLGSMDKD
jgi:hypothetical protein